MKVYTTHSPDDTQALAAQIVTFLGGAEGIRGTSTIIALQGNLGAGKTVFVKGVAKVLGVEETVTSPTFVIEKIYSLKEGAPWKRLIHIDAYRLESEEELNSIDWNNIATDPNNLIVMEWPEQVGRGMPERAVWIEFEVVDEDTRNIHVPKHVSIVLGDK